MPRKTATCSVPGQLRTAHHLEGVLFSPTLPHCTNPKPKASTAILAKGVPELWGYRSSHGTGMTLSPHINLVMAHGKLSGCCCLFAAKLFVQVIWTGSFCILGKMPKNNLSKHHFLYCGIKHFCFPTQSSGPAQNKWRCADKEEMMGFFAFQSKTWMSLN